jgi:regulator of PEP synthase PpsR (kinase-PPPase family)
MPTRHESDTAHPLKRFHLHLVSDATGETLSAIAKAALVQFEDQAEAEVHLWALVRTKVQAERVLQAIHAHPGIVMFTVVNADVRKTLVQGARKQHLPVVDVLAPVLDGLGHYLGAVSRALPGRQHVMDREYFRRIDAMQFSMAHDDGQGLTDLEEADIVLVGVSRTSKTPTSIYLANRGLKTANIPLIPNMPAPPELAALRKPLVVALTTNPERLVQVRRNRLLALNQKNDTDYVDLELVKEEVAFARRLFSQHGWPVIDVTRRSIEETAAAILNLYARRQEEAGEPHGAVSRGDE